MKRFIFAIVLVLAFCVDSWAINLRPYMQTPPEVQVFAKRVIEDGGKVVDLEFCQKYTRLSKQLIIWSNGKFVGDANMGVKLNSGVSVQTLYDLSGNNNDATQGTADNQPVWTANVQGGRYGMVFDGVDDDLVCTSNASLNITEAITILMGIKVESFTAGKYMGLFDKSVTTTSWQSYMVADTHLVQLELYGTTGGPLTGTGAIVAGAATLLNLNYDGANSFIYINGGLDNSEASTGSIGVSAQDLWIGTIDQSADNFFHGAITTKAILDVALTTAQRTATEAFLNAYYTIY